MTDHSPFPAWYCPIHHQPLTDDKASLRCPEGESYPKKGGVLRFVPESSYADAFGAQWNRYRLTQLDSYTGTTISRDRARRALGEALWSDLSGKQVLECGCGAGRFTEVLLQQGALVTSIDLSSAVDANQENFPQNSTHRVAQASILQLPFLPQQFDLVFCLGVVQHTPCPEKAIAALYAHVKPGGILVFDHFRPTLSRYTKTATLLRVILRRLPPAIGIKVTEALTRCLLPLHKLTRNFRLGQMLLSRISPVESYYQSYPQLDDELLRQWAVLDTHDYLTAWYSHTRRPGQIRAALKDLGLREISLHRAGVNTEARGMRPLTPVKSMNAEPSCELSG
ncbi:MAG TPA: class I SAM-dependent methyltransferase [Armatimonadota bacterium]|nr:class I SAM-dependent methyltransferase [Armatimonadota bacterium]